MSTTTHPLPQYPPPTSPLGVGQVVYPVCAISVDIKKLRALYTSFYYMSPQEIYRDHINRGDTIKIVLRKSDRYPIYISTGHIGYIESDRYEGTYDDRVGGLSKLKMIGYDVRWERRGDHRKIYYNFNSEMDLVSLSDIITLDPLQLKEYILYGKEP